MHPLAQAPSRASQAPATSPSGAVPSVKPGQHYEKIIQSQVAQMRFYRAEETRYAAGLHTEPAIPNDVQARAKKRTRRRSQDGLHSDGRRGQHLFGGVTSAWGKHAVPSHGCEMSAILSFSPSFFFFPVVFSFCASTGGGGECECYILSQN